MNTADPHDIQERENRIQQEGKALLRAFEAIAQPRSDYALEHFVLAQHDTVIRQWAQAVLELRVRVFNIARIQKDVELLDLDIEAEVAEADAAQGIERRRCQIKAEKLRIDREEAELGRLGNIREAETLLVWVLKLQEANGGQPYTAEQIEADEPRYWDLRLRRQLYLALRGAVDPGNGEALLQTHTKPGEERQPLIGHNEVMARLGISPESEVAMLEAERAVVSQRLLELRGSEARAPMRVGQ